MPKAEVAKHVVDEWEAGLITLLRNLKVQKPQTHNTYAGQALKVWKGCIRG